jgi:hypothetical protein
VRCPRLGKRGDAVRGEVTIQSRDVVYGLRCSFVGPRVGPRIDGVLAPKAPRSENVALCAKHEEICDANCVRAGGGEGSAKPKTRGLPHAAAAPVGDVLLRTCRDVDIPDECFAISYGPKTSSRRYDEKRV